MNLVHENPGVPLRVLLVNPTQDVFFMVAYKVCVGIIFGMSQTIDLILLVYVNDVAKAEELKWNLEGSALICINSITITTNVPKITDADVFIFISNFPNPNCFEIDKVDDDDYFASLYLILKIANNFEMPSVQDDEPQEEKFIPLKKIKPPLNKPRRPIIVTTGIVDLDIIKSFSRNLPDDIFFCPTSMSSMAKNILCNHLEIQLNELNEVYVWAANDNVFYVDVESPIYLPEITSNRSPCEWDLLGKTDMEQLKIDFTHFNAAWLKKDFQKKIYEVSSNHPHGSIYTAAKIKQALKHIWSTRSANPVSEHKCNIGVISDGTLGTIKGLPYFLPVVFRGDTFTINERLQGDVHLKQEIVRINKEALRHHEMLTKYCKQFMLKNMNRREDGPAASSGYRSSTGYIPSSVNSRDESGLKSFYEYN